MGDAVGIDRAGSTVWLAAGTDECTEIHHALGVGLDGCVGQQRLGPRPQCRLDFLVAGPACDTAMACQDALDVAIENGAALAECQRCNGRSGRTPHARQLRDGVGPGRKYSAMLGHDGACRRVQIARATVVAKPAPQREHVVFRGGGQGRQIGEMGDKALEIGDDRGNLGLLQHDFRQPDTVGVACALPWQGMAAVVQLPVDDAGRK